MVVGAIRPDRYAWRTVAASAVGYGLDGFDLLILGFALTAITSDLRLSTVQAGSLATLTLLGAVVGGVGFGLLSDRHGRIRVLTWSIVVFAVFTGLTALAQDYGQLAVTRFLAGTGIGGEFGIGMALVAEAWPARMRARATSLVGVGWQAGVLVAALVSAPVLTSWGWRGLFALGTIPALIAVLVRRQVAESPAFLAEVQPRGMTAPLRALVADPRTGIGLLVLTSVQNFGYYGLMTWLPTYLSTRFHYSLFQSAGWTAVTVVGMALGILLFGQLADRIGRRPSFWIFQLGAAASVLAYARLTDPVALLVGGAVMGAFANGMLGGYGALIADLYPTASRATAQNVLFNLGRAVGGFAPVAVAVVASARGFGVAIGLLAVIYVLDMAAMFLIPTSATSPTVAESADR